MEVFGPRIGFDGVEGSAIHWETAWRLVRELGAYQPEGGLQKPGDIPAGYKINPFAAWLVDWFFRIIKDEVPTTWAMEVESSWEWEFERFVLTGHGDVCAIAPDRSEAKSYDWKTGRIPVDAADVNWQVAGYMALIYLIYGVSNVEFAIGQPWNSEEDGYERISRVSLEGDALARNAANLEQRINEALDDPFTLNTGMSQCKYCVGLRCPAITALKDTMHYKLTPEALAGLKATQSDAELVDLVAECRTLTKPIEDAQDALKARLESAGQLVGSDGTVVRLKESSGGFNVVDPVGMYGWLKSTLSEEILAKSLSYPGGKIKDGLAKGLGIPATGKSEMTAKTVFEGGAAPFIEHKTKKQLVFA